MTLYFYATTYDVTPQLWRPTYKCLLHQTKFHWLTTGRPPARMNFSSLAIEYLFTLVKRIRIYVMLNPVVFKC